MGWLRPVVTGRSRPEAVADEKGIQGQCIQGQCIQGQSRFI